MLLIRLFLTLTLLASWFDTVISKSSLGLVSRRNRARKQALVAYRQGHYADALKLYRFVVSTSPAPTLAERINVGQTLFQLGQYAAARRELIQPASNPTPDQLAVAATQLGLIECMEKDTAAALIRFQKALLNNPDHAIARHNYELLKVRFSGKNPTRKTAQLTPNPTEAPQPRQGQQAEQTEQQRDQLNRFRNAAMSEQQARQLLDALQADDLPYELARRKNRSKPEGSGMGRW